MQKTMVYGLNQDYTKTIILFESKEEAMKMEMEKARRLRKRGYAVWQK